MEQHTVRTEAKYQGVMSHTMTSTLGTMVNAIEEATGMTAEEIMNARAEGESWSEIIADGGASVEDIVAILIEAKAERLQVFVDEGILSEEFVQQLLDMLALRWAAVLSN
jgi:predicted transcriptional regulator